MKSLPAEFKTSIRKAKRLLPQKFTDTLGLILIGSCAEECLCKNSDIDMVWIKKRGLNFKKLCRIKQDFSEKTTVICFSKKQILYHFKNSTTMAHSIKNGKVLYKNNSFIDKLMDHSISKPSRKWMKGWFEHWVKLYKMGVWHYRRNKRFHEKHCNKKCFCDTSDILARSAVNFAILFLELYGYVPTTKHKILKYFTKISSPELIPGLKISLKVSREGRNLSLKEAESVYITAKTLKEKIQRKLRNK
ncbi:MAG: hypothetical protein ABIH00_05690 [Armatimonadota bacterium]